MRKILNVTLFIALISSSFSRDINSIQYYKNNFTVAGALMKECEVNKHKNKKELQNCKNASAALKQQIMEKKHH